MPGDFVDCIVTSPPYWGLRNYGVDGQLGDESTLEEYVENLTGIFQELRRVLKDDGTLWLNLGDKYIGTPKGTVVTDRSTLSGSKTYQAIASPPKLLDTSKATTLKSKNLCGLPWRVALALQADGWILRSDIIWNKPSCLPESVTDRPTHSHEYIFLLSKSPQYYYDQDAIREPPSQNSHGGNGANAGGKHRLLHDGEDGTLGQLTPNPLGRNKRTVWEISPKGYPGAHFATFTPDLIRPCILAGCSPGGIVLDPFMGSGTVAQVAIETGRNWLGVEINKDYIKLANERLAYVQLPLIVPGTRQ